MSAPKYTHFLEVGAERAGEVTSYVPGWEITYPSRCNGHLGDLGFVASTSLGGSGFVHFEANGEPYGYPLTQAAKARIKAMRRDFRTDSWLAHARAGMRS